MSATTNRAGYLTDKAGARRVVPPGAVLALAGTAWYTQIGAHTPYWALVIPLFLVGAGLGATITPAMAAFQDLPPTAMGQATSALNVVQRVAGALGSAPARGRPPAGDDRPRPDPALLLPGRSAGPPSQLRNT